MVTSAVPLEMLKAADFITYGDDVPVGSNCSLCMYNKDGICQFVGDIEGKHIDLRGQPVTERDCCYFWDRPGTKRAWKQTKSFAVLRTKTVKPPKIKTVELLRSGWRCAAPSCDWSISAVLPKRLKTINRYFGPAEKDYVLNVLSDSGVSIEKVVDRGNELAMKVSDAALAQSVLQRNHFVCRVVGKDRIEVNQKSLKKSMDYFVKSGGTCKPGERADLTGCTPAKKPSPALKPSAFSQHVEQQSPQHSHQSVQLGDKFKLHGTVAEVVGFVGGDPRKPLVKDDWDQTFLLSDKWTKVESAKPAETQDEGPTRTTVATPSQVDTTMDALVTATQFDEHGDSDKTRIAKNRDTYGQLRTAIPGITPEQYRNLMNNLLKEGAIEGKVLNEQRSLDDKDVALKFGPKGESGQPKFDLWMIRDRDKMRQIISDFHIATKAMSAMDSSHGGTLVPPPQVGRKKRVMFKAFTDPVKVPKPEESYFSTCERDKEGHCLPKGATDSANAHSKATLHITPVHPGDTVKFGPDGEPIEGEIAGLPITSSQRGLIDKISKKTRTVLEEVFSDPEIQEALEIGFINNIRVEPTKGPNKPAGGWTAGHTGNTLLIHPRTAEALEKGNPIRRQYGLRRVIFHEVGHAVYDIGMDSTKEAFAAALKKHPEVVDHISQIVNVAANPDAFSKTGSRVVTEAFAELSAMRKYDPDRYSKLPEEVRAPIEAMHERAKHGGHLRRGLGVHASKTFFKSFTKPVKVPSVGTCKIGERSDLTGCTPSSGEPHANPPAPTSQADASVQETLEKAEGLTGKAKAVFQKAKSKVVGMYKDLEKEHGRVAAISIFAAGHMIGLGLPGVNLLPGSTFIATAVFAYGYSYAKRGVKLATGRKSLDVEAIARRLFAELAKEIEAELARTQ